MIPKECKRLAEVDFPIAEVSRHAVREKSIRHGHPSTLHLWWARRPLASSRAVLMALLLPDPCDPHCPAAFKQKASEILSEVRQPPKSDEDLRTALLWFIGAFANWDLAADRTYLRVARSLVQSAHPEEPPLVVDPFAGGGSIPLEALRLGCEAFASDLNPVACLILKVMLEDIPRHGPGLAEALRRVGDEIKRKAERELAELYPKDPDGATPIAYLWARTVRCEAPNCGAEIPLMRSFWLCKKAKRKRALRHLVKRSKGKPPSVEFEVFEPKADREVHGGTVTRAKATCLCCGVVLQPERVRAQLMAQRGGADVIFDAKKGRRTGGARMTAVVTLKPGEAGRHYRLPTDADYVAVRTAQERVTEVLVEWEHSGKQGLCPVPDETLNPIRPSPNARGLSAVTRYAMSAFGDLYTARQKLALVELGRSTVTLTPSVQQTMIALLLGRMADGNNYLARWESGAENPVNLFARQAVPMVWDFCESTPKSNARGVFLSGVNAACKVIENTQEIASCQVQQSDATDHPLPDQAAGIWFTDPPYYDAIPYADLSDFFLVWLKRTLPNHSILCDPFDKANLLSPKLRECVWNRAYEFEGRPKDAAFFEATISKAFKAGHRILSSDGIGAVVFAHQSTEGWEAFLSGLIEAGWTVTGSWPIATEMVSRIRARDNASLATSIHLICRPRHEDAPIGDWADVLRELPTRVADWIERLQDEGIRGADLVFACIGPALEIFSRYREVETAEGHRVGLPEYLEKVWEVVGRAALQQVLGTAEAQARNGLAGALEEDARLTALFLWTLQSTASVTENQSPAPVNAGEQDDEADEEAVAKAAATGFSLPFDVVRRFAQPMGIDLNTWTDRIIGQEKGIIRLLPVAERAKKLFGEDGAAAVALVIERDPNASLQQTLFPDLPDGTPTLVREPRPRYGESSDDNLAATLGDTTLDRVHTAMLLQSSGHTNALRTLIDAEQDRGPDFLRLANSLSALYPQGCNEKRLLDAMLLTVPR